MEIVTFTYHPKNGWSKPPIHLDSTSTLVLAFGASYDEIAPSDFRTYLLEKFPTSQIVGCSTAGEILQDKVFDGSVVIAVVRFDSTRIVAKAFALPQDSQNCREVGIQIAQTMAKPDLKGILILSNGINVNGSKVTQGVASIKQDGVAIFGGLAGDADRFKKTWTLCNNDLNTNNVVAVGFYGDNIEIRQGSFGGWDRFGIDRKITKSTGNILYELDNQPALKLYKEYLGEIASDLPASALRFPLEIYEVSGATYVRTILSIDEANQSMIFAGDIPQGATSRLMKANYERLIDGAGEAGSLANFQKTNGEAILALAISCVGRRLVLADRSEEELEAVLGKIPPTARMVGFYSYGEISVNSNFKNCDIQNQTMTLTLIRERSRHDVV